MNNFVVSLIRTWVPVGVGALFTWLAGYAGWLGLTDDQQTSVSVWAMAIVTAAYYGLVRMLETRWPAFGALLGAVRQPKYVEPAADARRPGSTL